MSAGCLARTDGTWRWVALQLPAVVQLVWLASLSRNFTVERAPLVHRGCCGRRTLNGESWGARQYRYRPGDQVVLERGNALGRQKAGGAPRR